MDRCYGAKLSDYDVNNLPADVIYCLCMDPEDESSYEISGGFDYDDELEIFIDEQNYPVQEFLRILYSGRLERFKDLILSGIFDLKIEEDLHQISSIIKEESKAKEEYMRTIIQMLYTTMKANTEENKILDISITDIRDNKIKASNPNLSLAIEQALSNEFIRMNLNETEMTIDEARVAIKNGDDIDFFFCDDEGLYSHCFKDDGKSIYFLPETLTEDDIEYYAVCHTLPREVSFDLVSKSYEEYIIRKGLFKKKRGARQINTTLSNFVLKFSFLARFDQFIQQDAVNDIWEYNLSNRTCLMIYDLLSLFEGIFRDNVIYAQTDRERRTAYIRALITQEMSNNKSKYSDIVNQINKIRRVRQGLDTFSKKDTVFIDDIEKHFEELRDLQARYDRGELR